MKTCCEYVPGLRYKLRMMGIPINLPTYVFGDNKSVLTNSRLPHSNLKKKSCSIAYHFVRERVARNEWRVAYLNTNLNCADMATKSLPGGEKRTFCIMSMTNVISFYLVDLSVTIVISIDGLDDDVRCRNHQFGPP